MLRTKANCVCVCGNKELWGLGWGFVCILCDLHCIDTITLVVFVYFFYLQKVLFLLFLALHSQLSETTMNSSMGLALQVFSDYSMPV